MNTFTLRHIVHSLPVDLLLQNFIDPIDNNICNQNWSRVKIKREKIQMKQFVNIADQTLTCATKFLLQDWFV